MSTTENCQSLPITKERLEWLKSKIRDIPDFPKPGIIYKDITTFLKDPEAMHFVVDTLAAECEKLKPSKIAGIEARGFILAPIIAYKLALGFVPIRKPGKLPYKTNKVSYDLEYGTDSLEIHIDAVEPQERIVLIDDLLATGGTAAAACQLLQKASAKVVGIGFVISLAFLNGGKKLPKDAEVFSIIQY